MPIPDYLLRTKPSLKAASPIEAREVRNARAVLRSERLSPRVDRISFPTWSGPSLNPPRTVLFVCVQNAGRSLMAEAMFNSSPPDGWVAVSAGTAPALQPNPRTGPMLEEIGMHLPGHLPRLLTPAMIDGASVRITMGCLDSASCPARLKSMEPEDWALLDPSKQDDPGFRKIRDDLRARVEGLKRDLALRR